VAARLGVVPFLAPRTARPIGRHYDKPDKDIPAKLRAYLRKPTISQAVNR